MMKRPLILCLAIVCLGGIILFARNHKLVNADPSTPEVNRSGTAPKRQRVGSPGESEETGGIPESTRHAAGDLESARRRKVRFAELDKAVSEQEDKVEERRKVLASIVRTKGIIYKGKDSSYVKSGAGKEQGARDALHTYNELEARRMQLESQINSLLKYDNEQLMVYASGLDLPDNTLKELYPEYLEAKRGVSELEESGMGGEHPSMKTALGKVTGLKSRLDEGIVNLRATLTAQLEMTRDRLKIVEVTAAEAREESIKRALDAQDYVDAKRDFETDQKLLEEMKLLRITEKMKD